jgi:uncharacterized protein
MDWRLYVLYDSSYAKAYAKLHFGKSMNIRFLHFTGSPEEFLEQEIMRYENEWRDATYVGVCMWDCNTRTMFDTRNVESILDETGSVEVINLGTGDTEFNGFMTPTYVRKRFSLSITI